MHSSPLRAMSRSSGPRGASVASRVAVALLLAVHGCASAGTGMSAARAAGAPPDRSDPRSVFLADLTSDELRAAVADGFTTALVYSGSTEGSGPALALGKHKRARAVLCRAHRARTRAHPGRPGRAVRRQR
jgi:hypothetical protein